MAVKYHPPSATADKKLYTSVTVLGLSPMYTELGKGTWPAMVEEKLQEAQMELKHKIAKILIVEEEELHAPKEQK